jgi:hypothetical protein
MFKFLSIGVWWATIFAALPMFDATEQQGRRICGGSGGQLRQAVPPVSVVHWRGGRNFVCFLLFQGVCWLRVGGVSVI